MSDPDSVTTRGVFTTSAATSLTAMGAASASAVEAGVAPEREQPAAPAMTIGSAIRSARAAARICWRSLVGCLIGIVRLLASTSLNARLGWRM